MNVDIDRIQMESFYASKSLPAFTSFGGSGDYDSILHSDKILAGRLTPSSSSDDNEDNTSIDRHNETVESLNSISEKCSDTTVQEICDKYTKLAASMNGNSDYASVLADAATSTLSKSSLLMDRSPSEFPYTMPSTYLSKLSTYPFLRDPDLNLTPDKRYTTFTTRLRSPSGDNIYHGISDALRESRVRFDPDVAVHQLSPDNSSIAASSPNSSMLDCSPRSIGYSSTHPVPLSGDSGSRFTTIDDDHDLDTNNYFTSEKSTEDLYSDLGSRSWSTSGLPSSSLYSNSSHSSSAHQTTGLSSSFGSSGSSATGEDSDDEPVSVVASDLKKYSDGTISSGTSSKSKFKSGHQKSNTAPAALGYNPPAFSSSRGRRSWPEFGSKSNYSGKTKVKSSQQGQKSDFAPLKDFSPIFESCECKCQVSDEVKLDEECLLARPGLNSTLRVSRKLEKLKCEEFNPVEALKSKVDPKTKQKIEEKAQAKLNVSAPQFSNLLSLEVRKEDLLKKVAIEKASQIKKEASDRVRHEDLVSRPPDIMDFFTDDLQKESVNHTLSGITLIPTPSRTVEPVRAFDVYRHIRQWRQWQ